MARSNGDLIAKARQMAEDVGRRAATVAEAREMLGVPKRRRWLAASCPLSDVRVLDLTRLLPGGFCSLLLADFGADVVKVEDTGMGDYVRWAPPFYGSEEQQALGTRSALYLALNRGKRSIRLDLKSEGGREALLRLAREYDVVLESFRPGVLDRLGCGYEALREANPAARLLRDHRLRPDRARTPQRAGHDMNYLGLNGLLGLTGEPDGRPIQSAGPDRRPGRRRADGRVRRDGGAARARALGRGPAGRRLDDRRRRSPGWRWSPPQYLCDGEVPQRGRGPAQRRLRSATCPTRPPTAGSPAARWSRSSGAPSARASGART